MFRAVIDVEKPEEYFFIVGIGDGHTANLKMLIVDGNIEDPAVEGWYRRSYGYSVHVGTGRARLGAGRHVLELYTNLSNPNIRIRVGSADAPVEALDGRFAHFDNAAKLVAGPLEAAGGSVADAWLETVRIWAERGRYTVARTLCRAGKEYFRGQGDVIRRLDDAAEGALQRSDLENWPTEGKYPSRIGSVPDAVFGPPFRQATTQWNATFHDPAGLSSSVWGEAGLVCGLPFKVFQAA